MSLIPSINRIKHGTWINKLSTNELYTLTEHEYDCLPYHLKEKYDYASINKNGFYVDYLFNELMISGSGTGLIRPDMIKSFLELSIKTSKH